MLGKFPAETGEELYTLCINNFNVCYNYLYPFDVIRFNIISDKSGVPNLSEIKKEPYVHEINNLKVTRSMQKTVDQYKDLKP